eukprot:CAMPEP_0197835482 /NCGR_PEP_ID=MMETSP1437-20131217/25855_1 /TAXON_ID=49252 ORGANISM="Eucampia antarctica, Strain CCMP1452" /NCGR_SAMPLE_ID=MMETSP1437 /ASSEMBLY_ACC=CAM_ASM_001096 /LENGTH=181 /DNA_ID=CAMNT_0043440941 /DNA_START=117 /DNA_END=659 /DNA_ORIENTATION=+
MAAAGGGYMSDYDVFPLRTSEEYTKHNNTFLPNDGFFTVHSIVPGSNGSGIPCLMSGNTEEWEKMAFKIVENGAAHPKERMWSDMFALMDLRHQNLQKELFHWEDNVIPGQDVLLGKFWSKEDCPRTKNYQAVHFSHDAIFNGKTTNFNSKLNKEAGDNERANWNKINVRATIIQKWFFMW